MLNGTQAGGDQQRGTCASTTTNAMKSGPIERSFLSMALVPDHRRFRAKSVSASWIFTPQMSPPWLRGCSAGRCRGLAMSVDFNGNGDYGFGSRGHCVVRCKRHASAVTGPVPPPSRSTPSGRRGMGETS